MSLLFLKDPFRCGHLLKAIAAICTLFLLLVSCKPKEFEVRTVTVNTPSGSFKVWTKRFGDNSRKKVLLLHGAGLTHEEFECLEEPFLDEDIEFIEYDQLGSFYSDHPNDTSLWHVDRMVDEVEQVRMALGLDKDNFFILGHDWGGILGMQYALKYQQNLKGLIVCNAFSSASIQSERLIRMAKHMGGEAYYTLLYLDGHRDGLRNPRYIKLRERLFEGRVIRTDSIPEPLARAFAHNNAQVDTLLQGRRLLYDGRLKDLNILKDLSSIKTPTLMVGATHDFVDCFHMKNMSKIMPRGQLLVCKDGSHFAMWDDPKCFINGVVRFINDTQ